MQIQQLYQYQTQLNKLTYKTTQPHPVTTLSSLKQCSSCSYCQVMKSVCDDLQSKIQTQTDQYNFTLSLANKINQYIFQFIEHHALQIQQSEKQQQNTQNLLNQKQKELIKAIQKRQLLINQLQDDILRKQAIIYEMEENYYRLQQSNKQNSMELQNKQLKVACQILAKHKRDKSNMYNKLQNIKDNLQTDKQRTLEENISLKQIVEDMRYKIEQLESNLLANNITTPRVIFNNNNGQGIDNSNQKLSEIDSQSSDIPNGSLNSVNIIGNNNAQNQSYDSFMGLHQGNALRDILNISGQTNKYFNFTRDNRFKDRIINTQSSGGFMQNSAEIVRSQQNRTNQKIQNSRRMIQGNNTVRVYNAENGAQEQNIKQFSILERNLSEEVSQITLQNSLMSPVMLGKGDNQCSNGSIIRKEVPNITVDPYFAFFTLTVQCIKLNWGNMDQVANIQLADQWDNIIGNGIQMNYWHRYLEDKMKEKTSKIKKNFSKKK